jgi:wbfy protein
LSVKDEKNPKGDIEIAYTGLRPGEKLYEELLIAGDNVRKTEHSRIMTAEEYYLPFDQLSSVLAQLEKACKNGDYMSIREILLNAPTGFNPTTGIVDVLYKD